MEVVYMAVGKALTGQETGPLTMVREAIILVLLCCSILLSSVSGAQKQKSPLSIEDIELLLQSGVAPQRVATLIEEQGVNFEDTRAVQTRLKQAGANDTVMHALKRARIVSAVLQPTKKNAPPKIAQRFPAKRRVTVREGESVDFSVLAVDPDGEDVGYTWFVDRKRTMQGDRFTYAASAAGSHRIDLEAIDKGGLKAVFWWEVEVEAPPAAPRLAMYTPYSERLRLYSHLSRFFGVQVEVPGIVEPSIRYEWKIDGRPVAGHEVFEFKNQAPGRYEVEVVASGPSGASVSHRWSVEVWERQKDDTQFAGGPPYLEVFDLSNETNADKNQLVVKGKIRNVGDRDAENVIIWVSALDSQREVVSRRLVLPTPQPLSPGQSAIFQTAFSNRADIADFHIEAVSK